MAKKKNNEPDYQKEVMTYLDRANQGAVISRAVNSLGPTRDKALKERDKYSIEALTKDPFKDGKPRFTADQFNALSEEDKEQKLAEALAYRQSTSLSQAIDLTSRNLEAILKKEDKWDTDLRKAAGFKEIVDNAPEKYKEVIKGYRDIANYEKLAKDKADGKAISPEDEKSVREIITSAEREKYLKSSKHLPNEDRKLGAQIAGLAPSESYTPEQLKDGVNAIIEDLKKNMKKKFGDNYEAKVSEGVGKAMETLMYSGDKEKQQAAMSIYNFAKKGYQIGERDFNEEFKKKD